MTLDQLTDEFEAFLRAKGFLLRRGVVPGATRWGRCGTADKPKSTNGAYKLAADGRIGWAQDHAVDVDGPITWRPDRAPESLPFDPAAHQRSLELARREREARERATREATERARRFYKSATPLVGGHPYLTEKALGMEGCRGLRVDREGWLVVPMGAGRKLISLQRISPEGEKKFWPGASTARGSYLVDRRGATVTVLCEGLATGLAIFGAVPETRVLIAFNAGNLPRVAAALPRRGLLVVASDNDHSTICERHRRDGLETPFEPWGQRPEWCRCNPGKCSAAEAAAILGCGFAVPEGIAGTDFNDLRAERIRERTREVYGRRTESVSAARRAADAEIAAIIMREARFLSAAG